MLLQDMIEDLVGLTTPEKERAEACKRFIERCGYGAAALTLLPIPLSDAIAIMPLHVGMITGIAHMHDVELTRDSAASLVLKLGGAAGLSLVSTRIATTAAKVLLPGLGGLLGAPFTYGSTIALGTVARAYFERGGSLSEGEIATLYKDTLARAKQAFDPERARSAEVKAAAVAAAAAQEAKTSPPESPPDPTARLEKLRELREKGLIEQAEFEATKKRILGEL